MIRTSGFLPTIKLPLSSGSIDIPTYFIVVSAIFVSLAFIIRKRADTLLVSVRAAMDGYIAIMVGGLIGSRAVHVIWEEPLYYSADPIRIFDFISGGFVWYGGFLGALIGFLVLYRANSEVRQRSRLWWLDFFTPLIALGYAAGRFACFLTGCCFGDECHWFEWMGGPSIQFPTQIFAFLWDGTLGYLIWNKKIAARLDLRPGQVFWTWLGWHGVGRILMELMRADDRGPNLNILGLSWTLSTGLSVLFILISLAGRQRLINTFKSFKGLNR